MERTETDLRTKLTWWGSAICINDESWIMDMMGTMKAYEPPITVGNRVPNRVCRSVLIPSTKSRVCTTLTLSSWSHPSNYQKQGKKENTFQSDTQFISPNIFFYSPHQHIWQTVVKKWFFFFLLKEIIGKMIIDHQALSNFMNSKKMEEKWLGCENWLTSFPPIKGTRNEGIITAVPKAKI